MTITKSELKTILNMQRALSTINQEDGTYSVAAFDQSATLVHVGIETADTLYHKTSQGDYVTVGHIHSRVYTGERIPLWASLTASTEFSDLVLSHCLNGTVVAGECFFTLVGVQSLDNASEYLVPYQCMKIPADHVGYITRAINSPPILTITRSEETLIGNLRKKFDEATVPLLKMAGVKKTGIAL